jgi:predicted permease
VPSLRACTRLDPEALREGARAGTGVRRTRLRRALVVFEVGASLVLLVASGLLLRALWRVQQTPPGFVADGVLTVRTQLPLPRYDKVADRAAFYERVLTATRALPGVRAAAYTSFVPMAMGGGIWPVAIPGRAESEADRKTVSLRYVTPGYYAAMGIPLRAGRDVGETDVASGLKVAVVSESFARRTWPGEDPLGKTFEVAFFERTVVGVAGDVRTRGLERDAEPQVYLPYRQIPDGWMPFYNPKDLVVRASVDPSTLVAPLRAIVAAADPEQPLSNVRLLEEIVDAQTASRRVQLLVIVTFAGLAFLLAAIGIYGLLAFGVSNRAQEIAVRLALGATPGGIVALVLREAFALAALGALLGLGLAYAAARSLAALLAGVSAGDAVTFGAALGVAVLMTLAGSVVPARRAARVDAAAVMRGE